MNILACDIGNSSTKFGLFSRGILQNHYQLSHDDFSYAKLSKHEFDFAAISSVVPVVTDKLSQLFETQFEITPLIVSQASDFNLQINYDSPETLGIDRICGAEGAFFAAGARPASIHLSRASPRPPRSRLRRPSRPAASG